MTQERPEDKPMTDAERSQVIWALLISAADHRQELTYGRVASHIGVRSPRAIGRLLGPIQAYCQLKGLPPLTVLVVRGRTGQPGDGFIAASDLHQARQQVFRFGWYRRRLPSLARMAPAQGALIN